jgi:acetyl-CoA acetyltransferase
MAALHAGIPISTSIATVNRQCSSGLTAVNLIAAQILAGQIDIGIGTYWRVFFCRLLMYLAQVPVSSL